MDFAKDNSKPVWELFGGDPKLWFERWYAIRVQLTLKEKNNV